MEPIKIKRIDTPPFYYHFEDQDGLQWCHLSKGNTPALMCDQCDKLFDEGWTCTIHGWWWDYCSDCIQVVQEF